MFEYINSATNAVFTQFFSLTKQDIPLASPEQYRANANAANAAQAALRKTSVILAATPASAPSSPGFSPVKGSSSTSAAVVVGAAVPTGLTSTGKASTMPPPISAPTPAPIALITSSNSINRPAQGNSTDAAIASLGKSYKGTFV
jgi:hypothetical protein